MGTLLSHADLHCQLIVENRPADEAVSPRIPKGVCVHASGVCMGGRVPLMSSKPSITPIIRSQQQNP